MNDLDAQIVASTDTTSRLNYLRLQHLFFTIITYINGTQSLKKKSEWPVCVFHSTCTFYYYCPRAVLPAGARPLRLAGDQRNHSALSPAERTRCHRLPGGAQGPSGL